VYLNKSQPRRKKEMTRQITRQALEGSYIKSSLNLELRQILGDAMVEKIGDSLKIYCSPDQKRQLTQNINLFRTDQFIREANSKIKELYLIPSVGSVTIFPLEVEYSRVPIIMETNIEIVTEVQVLTELALHEQKLSLPANFIRMRGDRPYLMNELIIQSTGLPKGQMIDIPSVRPWFPTDEYDKLVKALIDADGKEVEINYFAAKISEPDVYDDRLVVGRLVNFLGEPWRIMKHLRLPRRMD
jgi:hypothetical protein